MFGIKDVYPLKAQYRKGEPVRIAIEIDNRTGNEQALHMEVVVRELNRIVYSMLLDVKLDSKPVTTHVADLEPFMADFKGYGVDVALVGGDPALQWLSTSFDVVSDWRRSTRYGFLSDFHSKLEGDGQDVASLNKLHLNLVQFYDWMYRHNDLVPPQDVFTDLMGRELSLKVVKEKIGLCRRYGMKAIAYGAVYAASKAFYEEHPDWALYYSNGKVIDFIKVRTGYFRFYKRGRNVRQALA
ncbi:glycoside hydrolase family 66 protein [uncultured Paenibacillus sp.]|uniref:glycoside hydrolase family 66 protein n=1 Tax=uncultured Paenibacillus sp. TaxID=227322 RepID=UPI0028D3AC0D|nr:glycoside hydrolase family 66 protein [uncultured Paenibacillus sp.]